MVSRPDRSKTVYVFGAGATKAVGGPTQQELLEDMLAAERQEAGPWPELQFVRDVFLRGSAVPGSFPLEDAMTLLDRAILDGVSVRGYATRDLMDVRRNIVARIAKVLRIRLERPMDPAIGDFASAVLSKRASNPDRHYDPLAILTFNWDIVLDHPLYEAGLRAGHDIPIVDYCTYTYSLDRHEFSMSPHHARALGIPNVKLLKLHGSLSWLACPNCNRLFADFRQKITEYAFGRITTHRNTCRFCEPAEDFRLEPVIITPTLMKDFRLIHLRNVWHNAFIELTEASRVVFVGYSLPLADFEARSLFARAIPHDARIEVHLHKNPMDAAASWARAAQVAAGPDLLALMRRRPRFEHLAYEDFFGEGRCEFFYNDALVFFREEARALRS